MRYGEDLKKRGTQGFTIVELLIVVVVIAILAVIVIVAYNGITSRADDSRLASLQSQLEKKARTNQAVSSTRGILMKSTSGSNPTTRQEFLQFNGIEQASADICLRAYNSNATLIHVDGTSCYPNLVVGEVPKYDKKKLYIDATYGVGTSNWIGYSYWSNKDSTWVYRQIVIYANGAEEVSTRTGADTHDLVCDPFGSGTDQYPHDDCRYDPVPL